VRRLKTLGTALEVQPCKAWSVAWRLLEKLRKCCNGRHEEQASRVIKDSAVVRALRGGLAKDVEDRMDIEAWREEMKGS